MVTADRAVEAELPDFVVALQRLDARLTERLGPGPAQSVLFGGRKEDWRALRVEDWQIARAREVGWDHVAALVVTQSRCRDPFYGLEKVDNGVVEALARTLVPVPPGTLPWLAVDEGSIADGVARIAALGGWEQTLRAGCGG